MLSDINVKVFGGMPEICVIHNHRLNNNKFLLLLSLCTQYNVILSCLTTVGWDRLSVPTTINEIDNIYFIGQIAPNESLLCGYFTGNTQTPHPLGSFSLSMIRIPALGRMCS